MSIKQMLNVLTKQAALVMLMSFMLPSVFVQALDVQPRIIGGSNVTGESYPWQVALLEASHPQVTLKDSLMCGGSIIHERWILSAAHCFDLGSDNPSRVLIGLKDLDDENNINSEIITIESVYKHENYVPQGASGVQFNNDIALIKLTRAIDMDKCNSSGSCVIPLVDGNKEASLISDGTPVWISGWGSTSESSPYVYPSNLQEANINMLGCTDSRVSDYPESWISANMICAQAVGKDTCVGDSGGPMVAASSLGLGFILVGITSWGPEQCNTARKPGVYTRLANYGAWINEITNNVINVPECEVCSYRTKPNTGFTPGDDSSGSLSTSFILIFLLLGLSRLPVNKPSTF